MSNVNVLTWAWDGKNSGKENTRKRAGKFIILIKQQQKVNFTNTATNFLTFFHPRLNWKILLVHDLWVVEWFSEKFSQSLKTRVWTQQITQKHEDFISTFSPSLPRNIIIVSLCLISIHKLKHQISEKQNFPLNFVQFSLPVTRDDSVKCKITIWVARRFQIEKHYAVSAHRRSLYIEYVMYLTLTSVSMSKFPLRRSHTSFPHSITQIKLWKLKINHMNTKKTWKNNTNTKVGNSWFFIE